MKKHLIFLKSEGGPFTWTHETYMHTDGESVEELYRKIMADVWKNEQAPSVPLAETKTFSVSIGGVMEINIPVRSNSFEHFNEFVEAGKRVIRTLEILLDDEGEKIVKIELSENAKEALLKRWVIGMTWGGMHSIAYIDGGGLDTFCNMQALERFRSDKNAQQERVILRRIRQQLAAYYLTHESSDLAVVSHMFDTYGFVDITPVV